jgi:hypothetical protein
VNGKDRTMRTLPSFARTLALLGAIIGTAVLAAAPSQATGRGSAGSRAHQTPTLSTSDPLLGTWDTGPFPIARVRAAAVGAGYTKAEVARFFNDVGMGSAKTVEVRLRFYRYRGLPYVEGTGWDPTKGKPSGGDHGPYKLLANNRLAITSADPKIHKYRQVYTWRVSGQTLTLRVVGSTDPNLTPARLRLESVSLYFQAAAPFKKTK